jgi:MOSC domain-containing protein YiiM
MSEGTLLAIARHARSKAPMELIDHAEVTREAGIRGDFRGGMKGKPYKRQVTLIERGDWEAALAEVGHSIAWQERRSNLLVDGFDLPQVPGTRLRIGADVVLEITRECDPCERMEALAPGLKAALLPDWRGGACAMVIEGGRIAPGDLIRIDTWHGSSARSTTSAMSMESASSSART